MRRARWGAAWSARSPAGTLVAVVASVLLLAACGAEEPRRTDSRTGNWTILCEDTADCPSGSTCECGVCTSPCDDMEACAAPLECTPVASIDGCQSAETAICAEPCATAAGCTDEDAVCTDGGICGSPAGELGVRTQAACRLEADPSAAEFQPGGEPVLDCSCDETSSDCRSAYDVRVTAVDGLDVDIEVRPRGPLGVEPAEVRWGASLTARESTSCWDIEALTPRATGTVMLGDSFSARVPVLQLDGEFDRLPDGTEVRLVVTTGSDRLPDEEVFYSGDGIVLRKVCDE
jgi:hypothetical protein